MQSLKILIVDDVILTANDLRTLLESEGHVVTATARNRQQAIEAIKTVSPDLALIDIILDGSDGDGIRTAKELVAIHPMPVIYLTGNNDVHQFREAQGTHPTAYLLKPFNTTELLFNIELAFYNYKAHILDEPLEGHLLLPADGGLELINLNDVVYLNAHGSYSTVVLDNGTKHLVSTNLGHLERYFEGSHFFRVSRSNVINLKMIKRIKDGVLTIGTQEIRLSLAENSRKEMLRRLKVVRTKPLN